MALKKLHFVTSNKDKLREAQEILGIEIIPTHADLIEPQSMDLDENVRFKAEQAYKLVGEPVIVDDVGVYLDAWNGRPGPLIKFFLEDKSPELLLKMLKHETNRKVTAICAIGFHDGKEVKVILGEVHGTVPKELRGDMGFGWDPIFIPEGQTKSYAQMTPEQKNAISHRFAALVQLKSLI